MKPNACLLKTLLIAASLGVAAPLLAQGTAPATPPKPNVAKSADTKKPAPPEEAPKIPGVVVSRPNGSFLGVLVEDGRFKISFYDAKKKPVPVDVSRASARWPVHYKVFDERTVLNPNGDGTALTSPKFVRPPYTFKLYLSLFGEGNDQAVEQYVIDFRQPAPTAD